MRKIKLGSYKKIERFVLVSDVDFEWLNQYKWCFGSGYPMTSINKKTVLMHRLINNTPKGMQTDHFNRNKLDNRRENLRTVTSSQNNFHKIITKNKSGVRGIYWEDRRKRWVATIWVNYKALFLGRYKEISDAIIARKKAEIKYFGEVVIPIC